MEEFEKERYRKLLPGILESLKKKKYDAYFFEIYKEARSFILSQIDKNETVGIGGSLTLRENLNLSKLLKERGNKVYDHVDAGKDNTKRLKIKRIQSHADVFLSSINAITLDGILVNLDGGGNRVSGLCSGPKKVFVVAGTNKIVDNIEMAINRTRYYCAPINAGRLRRKVPCATTGVCSDCDSPERICAALLILLRRPKDIDLFTIILVNEKMGI